jgi:type 1 glutamine amidotransferase
VPLLWYHLGPMSPNTSRTPLAAGVVTAALLAITIGSLAAQQPQPACGGRSATPQVACQADVDAMMAALPASAPAKPAKPRKVLVLGRAAGFVHSSIPLAAKTVDALGAKTGAWKTTITYDAADITTQNLAQYDAVILDNTTGCFLDDLGDAAATSARRAALLAFIRGGKGIAGIHAASDSYHGNSCADGIPGAPSRGAAPGADRPAGPPPVPGGQPLWPEWNKIIGGYFKFHWNDPQLITVKIDDPKSPLTAVFHGQEFEIHDETYTYNQDSFSRANVHVLTSVDYGKMSDADKVKETVQRTDHDYALSWIRPEGKGRLFYEAHGHGERVYAMTPWLEHVMAGIQYAIGDLKADDTPSAKTGAK